MSALKNTALGLADRPICVFMLLLAGLAGFAIVPWVDDQIPILRGVRAYDTTFIDSKEIAWKLAACRWRGGVDLSGIQFDVYHLDDPPYPLRGVMDQDAGVVAGTSHLNLSPSDCRRFSYSVDLGGQAVAGDVIKGTARYSSKYGWWALSDDYGEFTIPEFPKVLQYQQGIIQRELEAQGQGLDEFRK